MNKKERIETIIEWERRRLVEQFDTYLSTSKELDAKILYSKYKKHYYTSPNHNTEMYQLVCSYMDSLNRLDKEFEPIECFMGIYITDIRQLQTIDNYRPYIIEWS